MDKSLWNRHLLTKHTALSTMSSVIQWIQHYLPSNHWVQYNTLLHSRVAREAFALCINGILWTYCFISPTVLALLCSWWCKMQDKKGSSAKLRIGVTQDIKRCLRAYYFFRVSTLLGGVLLFVSWYSVRLLI